MAKRKTTKKRSAPRRYYAAPRRRSRKSTGVAKIPAAAATVGYVVANKNSVDYMLRNPNLEAAKATAKYLIQPEQIKKGLVGAGVGYVAGEAIRRYAPAFIKTPAGKLAKKIPKVI